MDHTIKNHAVVQRLLHKSRAISVALESRLRVLLRVNEALGITWKNVFEPGSTRDFERLKAIASGSVKIPKNIVIHGFDACQSPQEVIAIRAFRGDLTPLWSTVDKLRIFLSSGTTSGPEGRSRSGFSPEGLAHYQAASIAAYFSVLESLVAPFSADILNTVTVSLVPTVDEWPDSSLAQMIAWFGEIWPVEYASTEDSASLKERVAAFAASGQPIVLFGTAFHFVNLLDEGFKAKLPAGSLVVETGGTKGKSRTVTRAELYELIREGLGVCAHQIVSEYGMCELASQAWDLARDERSTGLDGRTFRFPWWARCSVDQNSETFLPEGDGALSIQDPLRSDLGGLAIQTEDVASLKSDQSFRLLGRVPRSPLKGCSLRVQDVRESAAASRTKSLPEGVIVTPDKKGLLDRAARARLWADKFLDDPRVEASLTREFGLPEVAGQIIHDIKSALPKSSEALATAAINACAGGNAPLHWCFIPPASHSVAIFQPLLAAMILGLDTRVRCPAIASLNGETSFVDLACESAAAQGFPVSTLPASWRLGTQDLRDGERVLVFGDDETVSFFRAFAPGRVSGFGSAVAAVAGSGGDFESPEFVDSLINDHFNLAQRGCLSARFTLCASGEPGKILDALLARCPDYWAARSLTAGEKAAIGIEKTRLAQLGAEVRIHHGHIIFAAIKAERAAEAASMIERVASRLDFVIVVVTMPDANELAKTLSDLPEIIPLKTLSVSDLTLEGLVKSKHLGDLATKFRVVRPGMLGAPVFDGTHLGRRFFDSLPV